MRYATVVLTWADGRLNAIDDAFARSDAVSIEAIRHLNPVGDDRYVELLELRGDLERARELLDDSPDALEYDVTGDRGRGVAYVQCRTVGPVDALLAILDEHELVLDWPMTYVDAGDAGTDRGLEVTAVGTSRSIQRAAAALPEGIDLDLRRMGEYEPDAGGFAPTLTDRQRELFELALEDGYYEIPRETTHRELAAKLDLAAGTVGEHLQRIEAKLAASYASAPSMR
ncbi:helix-turn-helix domain-containing protein [Halopiger xanaduensis]|uniref:Bacterio-opsin activator HTH domain protein n=1 Tax=Halopiger xanaduensis (strain DSM 18323 / JCM 14033 / SH-6) TaxID=797210 RepID=F8D8Y5_HALXS|nr:helix-turn-helix domain-containing protein [Halopiger xanaduensis]AEH37097.1 Bacterio-opsin activator HTH domain protein [Halopiger xanaduensis SH-6]